MPTAWSWKAGRGRRSKGGPAGSAAQTPRRGCRGSPSAFAAREADCAASGRGPAAAGDVFFSNEKNTPQPPLKRPKEGLRPFLWKPFRSLREFFERRARALRCELTGDIGTWDESWKLWRLWSFRALRFAENEVGDSPADLGPALGVYRPSPLRIPRLSVGGGLCPAPPGAAGNSDGRAMSAPSPAGQGSLV